MTTDHEDEERLLRSVALQNAHSIHRVRLRAEDELRRTREALRESQERLTAALTAAGTGTFRWDIPTNAVEWDGNLDRLFGLTSDRATQSLDAFLAAVHVQDRPGVVARLERSAAEGSDFHMEFRVEWRDGSVHWILAKARAFVDEDRKPLYMTGACADVTTPKYVEAALREESRILELLNETGRTLASQLDVQQIVETVTDAGTQLSGAQFGAFFSNAAAGSGGGLRLAALSGAPPDGVERWGADTFTGKYAEGSAQSLLTSPVRSRSGDVIGGLVFGHSAPRVFTERAERLVAGMAAQAGIAIDNARLYEVAQKAADERKSLLERERAARAAAERMSDVKDEFLATLSHELRTPLNAILGWSQILRIGPRFPPDYLKGLETIERNARMQAQLIEDLLDMSRIASGKLRLDIQPLQPASCVEAAVETLQPTADAKGIRLETVLDPTAGPMSGDPGRLQQVVWNLLSNAIKFTPAGGKVQVVLERVRTCVELRVTDTGVGIKPEFIPYLFERFRQADASTTRKYGGLGLGLSIVKSLVELHAGSVDVASPGEGKGTTVTVTFPLTEAFLDVSLGARLRAHVRKGSAIEHLAPELAGLKVLVVDDQADARELITRVLEQSAAEVVTACTADEALELIEAANPDILVSDIGLPDADGFELLRRVRALTRGESLPAVALTAFARSEDRTRALRAGFLVHVSKPVDPSELVATVASVAGRVDKRSR